MIATLAFFGVLMLSVQCVDINSVEFSPFYDAIIFGDIAEIINEFDNNMNFSTDRKRNSESASDEEVESLLSEYQHYLEKAQKQRVKHFEKTKGKNKTPLLRHEKFSKLNFPKTYYNDRSQNYYPSNIQLSQKYFNPYDFFAPMQLDHQDPFDTIWYKNKMSGFPSSIYKTRTNAIPSSCFCEENKFPCRCNCKQCLIPLGNTQSTYFEPTKAFNNDNPLVTSSSFRNIGYSNENTDDLSERKLNIRIKVDVQMPKIGDVLKKIQKGYPLEDTDTSEAFPPLNVSIPPLNFPIPLNIITYGLSKLHNFDNAPIHKISLHKKKKPHSNYQNKKHRSKYLSFHHAKASSYQTLRTTEKYNNDSHNFTDTPEAKQLKIQINITQALEPSAAVNISDLNPILNDTIVNLPAFVNVSSDDNLVEMDITTQKTSDLFYTRWAPNNATDTLQFIRIKREDNLSKLAIIDNKTLSNINLLKVKGLNTSISNTATTKDNKQLSLDSDLLYWPSKVGKNVKDTSAGREVQLEEDKFNISEYIMYVNSSGHKDKLLININWNDIDIIASMFSSLVGKNMNGILTFCSETFCRSLNCAEKMCTHRSCTPEERFNQRGHCIAVSNETDSKISMESSTNVTSNIAFDLIDIMQNQMLGQIFGKSTICIDLKCMSFVANKKMFTKFKCSKKELNSEGHCENFKKS